MAIDHTLAPSLTASYLTLISGRGEGRMEAKVAAERAREADLRHGFLRLGNTSQKPSSPDATIPHGLSHSCGESTHFSGVPDGQLHQVNAAPLFVVVYVYVDVDVDIDNRIFRRR